MPTAPSACATRRMVAGWRVTTVPRPCWGRCESVDKRATAHHSGIFSRRGALSCNMEHGMADESSNQAAPPPAAGDTKPCPFCGEEIKKVAVRCKHCQADLSKQPEVDFKG